MSALPATPSPTADEMVKHAIHGTMVRALPAREPKPGKWCCVACSVCGLACFCDLDDAMKSAQAHPECLK